MKVRIDMPREIGTIRLIVTIEFDTTQDSPEGIRLGLENLISESDMDVLDSTVEIDDPTQS